MNRIVKNTTAIVLLAGILLSIFSCENMTQDVDTSNLPTIDPKLAVYSFISPSDTDSVRVSVWISEPVIYNKPVKVEYIDYHNEEYGYWYYDYDRGRSQYERAEVTIRCESTGKEAKIPYLLSSRTYAISQQEFPIKRGYTYTLTATADEAGVKPIKARATVPYSQPVARVDRDLRFSTTSWDERVYIRGHIEDIPEEKNFYRVFGAIIYENCHESYNCIYRNSEGELDTIYGCYPEVPDLYVAIDTLLDCYENSNYSYQEISDESRDGTNLRFSVDIYLDYCNLMYRVGKKEIQITILSADDHYYRYGRSLEAYWMSEGNPFAEASPLYSNVENGLGIFCSFIDTVMTRPIELEEGLRDCDGYYYY